MRRRAAWVALACGLLVATAAAAQRSFGRIRPAGIPRGSGFGTQFGLNGPRTIDGAFQFCRIAFRQSLGGDGGNWSVDYPEADQNFSTRLSELTKASISRNDRGEPNHVIVRLTDPELFECPFVMMTEVGSIFLDEEESASLRNYLVKGGFLWADDFWGTFAWDVWETQLRKVLPSGAYPVVDVPIDHSIFTMVFSVKRFPQIPSINAWGGPGGRTSERGADSAVPHLRAIYDEHKRMMVLISHNTDFGDSWEREAYDPNYFREFSVDGYAFGINALIYSMTH
jgi:hypothetical protein